MAKQTGLGAALFHNGYDVTTDIRSVNAIKMPSSLLDVTSIDKSAIERLYGLRDGEITVSAYFDDAVGFAHPAFKTLPKTDVHQMYCHRSTLGAPAAAHVGRQINYDPQRGADGSLIIPVQVLSNSASGYPVMWGLQLTAGKDNLTGAVATTGVDFGTGSLAFGLAAYLQVFGFTGTSATITIQESSDNGVGDPFANVTGGAFAAVSGANVVERIETSLTQTVERYLRLNITGTFTSLDYAVMVIRYAAANREG